MICDIFKEHFKNIKICNNINENNDFLILRLLYRNSIYLLESIDIEEYFYDEFDVIINIERLNDYLSSKRFIRNHYFFISNCMYPKRIYGIVHKKSHYEYTISQFKKRVKDNVKYVEDINHNIILINNNVFFNYEYDSSSILNEDEDENYDYYEFLNDERNYSMFQQDIKNMFE